MIGRLRSSDTVRHGVIVFGGFVVSSVFNYLYYMLMGRLLGVEAYGIVTSMVSALLVVGAPAMVGQLIAARLAADLAARGDAAALRRLADLATIWLLGIAAVVVVIGLLAREQLAAFFNLPSSEPIDVTVVALGVFAVVTVQRGVLQGAHRFQDLSISMGIEGLVKVLSSVFLAGVLGASGAILGVAASVVIAFGYNLYAFRARFGNARSAIALDRDLIVRVITRVGLGQLTITFMSYYDVPLVKHLFDARSAGLYAAAALVGRAVLAAVAFVPVLVLPKVSARVAAERSPVPLLLAAIAIALCITAFAAVCSVVAPRAIVTAIAGKAFGDAGAFVLLYVLASGALALASVVVAYRIGLHRYGFVAPAMIVALGELTTIALWHPGLPSVLGVLAVGHAAVFAVTLIGLSRPIAFQRAEDLATSHAN